MKTRLPLHPPAPLIISSIQMLAAFVCTSLRPSSPNVPGIVLDRPGNKSYGQTPGACVGDPRRQDGSIRNEPPALITKTMNQRHNPSHPRRRSREIHRSQAQFRNANNNNPAPRLGDGHANPDPKGTDASSGSPEGETTVILDRCYHSYGIIRRPITNHQNLISTYFHAFNMTDPIASPSL